jgi:hypothetical protein
VIIRSQQQSNNNNLQSGSVSPVPGNILPTADENDMYLLNNPYEYRNNNRYANSTSSSSYHIYSNDNPSNATTNSDNFSPYDHSNSPYIQQRKLQHASVIDHVDKNESEEQNRRGSIDFPTSPPPEASTTTSTTPTSGLAKYSSYVSASSSSWSESNRPLPQDMDAANRKSLPLGKLYNVYT